MGKKGNTYKVKKGESYHSIAGKLFGGDVAAQRHFVTLMNMNKGAALHAGDTINIPGFKQRNQMKETAPTVTYEDIAHSSLIASGSDYYSQSQFDDALATARAGGVTAKTSTEANASRIAAFAEAELDKPPHLRGYVTNEQLAAAQAKANTEATATQTQAQAQAQAQAPLIGAGSIAEKQRIRAGQTQGTLSTTSIIRDAQRVLGTGFDQEETKGVSPYENFPVDDYNAYLKSQQAAAELEGRATSRRNDAAAARAAATARRSATTSPVGIATHEKDARATREQAARVDRYKDYLATGVLSPFPGPGEIGDRRPPGLVPGEVAAAGTVSASVPASSTPGTPPVYGGGGDPQRPRPRPSQRRPSVSSRYQRPAQVMGRVRPAGRTNMPNRWTSPVKQLMRSHISLHSWRI